MSKSILSISIPRYQILAEQLINGILSGEHAVGEYLPTEATLRSQYNVSRFTVREAMKILKQKGLIATRRGVGSEVISEKVSEESYSFYSSSYTDFLTNATTTKLTDITTEMIDCDDELATLMRCNPGQKILKVSANRIVELPVSFCVSTLEIFILGRYASIQDQIGEQQAISKMIGARFGIKTSEIKQRISPVIIESDKANILSVEAGSPGLKITRAYYDNENELYELVINYHAGEHGDITMNIKPNSA